MAEKHTAYAARTEHRLGVLLLVFMVGFAGAGCMDRRLNITSEPPGAIVWLNDTEVGRTPVRTRFLWYGTYDVRLHLEGHEPLMTSRHARTPIYETPPLDLPASAFPIRTQLHWHFDLTPSPAVTEEAQEDLIGRARELRKRLD